MGILDVFKKKKKEEESDVELPELPETEAESAEEELPPLPEIKMEPDLPEDISAEAEAPETAPDEPEAAEPEPVAEPEAPEPVALPEPVAMGAPVAKPDSSELPASVFVSANDYQKMLDGINFVKSKIDVANEYIKDLEVIQNAEGKQLASMRSTLEDVQRKITYADEVIFQAE